MNKPTALLIALCLVACLPIPFWGQALPTTMVVSMTDKAEWCYDLTQISKLSFESGQLKVSHSEAGKGFTPEAFALPQVLKIAFATDKQPNHSPKVLPQRDTSLTYTLRNGVLTVMGFSKLGETVSIYTPGGKLLHRDRLTTFSYSVDVSTWMPGIYLLTTTLSETLKIAIQ